MVYGHSSLRDTESDPSGNEITFRVINTPLISNPLKPLHTHRAWRSTCKVDGRASADRVRAAC